MLCMETAKIAVDLTSSHPLLFFTIILVTDVIVNLGYIENGGIRAPV